MFLTIKKQTRAFFLLFVNVDRSIEWEIQFFSFSTSSEEVVRNTFRWKLLSARSLVRSTRSNKCCFVFFQNESKVRLTEQLNRREMFRLNVWTIQSECLRERRILSSCAISSPRGQTPQSGRVRAFRRKKIRRISSDFRSTVELRSNFSRPKRKFITRFESRSIRVVRRQPVLDKSIRHLKPTSRRTIKFNSSRRENQFN